jgi:hypothetical protein
VKKIRILGGRFSRVRGNDSIFEDLVGKKGTFRGTVGRWEGNFKL